MLRCAIALGALLFASAGHAQVSGSVAVVSDYRFRGVSLSDNRPALQLGIAYDHADGWYAGAFASSVRPSPKVGGHVQLASYLGYARRLHNGLSWEAGASYAILVGGRGYDYPEVYVGLASDHLVGRLYFSHHFDEASPAVYAELNGTRALSERTRLIGHLGWLHQDRSRDTSAGLERQRFDLRAGIGITLTEFDLQVAGVVTQGSGGRYSIYPVNLPADRLGWVLSASRSW